ncbi:hypothetical protein RF11_14693 [Thelohanellus kitauei]|uniref:Uncharacterized protein n=1 Tax=Thelohanellus kitauei TaxID=669202 RepID=A0A0C2NAY4_THEKT|nr:hypothetical protein RF11_14693 [Thelohanellus kitauei]
MNNIPYGKKIVPGRQSITLQNSPFVVHQNNQGWLSNPGIINQDYFRACNQVDLQYTSQTPLQFNQPQAQPTIWVYIQPNIQIASLPYGNYMFQNAGLNNMTRWVSGEPSINPFNCGYQEFSTSIPKVEDTHFEFTNKGCGTTTERKEGICQIKYDRENELQRHERRHDMPEVPNLVDWELDPEQFLLKYIIKPLT